MLSGGPAAAGLGDAAAAPAKPVAQTQSAAPTQYEPQAQFCADGSNLPCSVLPAAPPNPVPGKAVPRMLSNVRLESYIQNYSGSDKSLPCPGSCVSCHAFGTLPADNKTSPHFSFLPFLAEPSTARRKIMTAH